MSSMSWLRLMLETHEVRNPWSSMRWWSENQTEGSGLIVFRDPGREHRWQQHIFRRTMWQIVREIQRILRLVCVWLLGVIVIIAHCCTKLSQNVRQVVFSKRIYLTMAHGEARYPKIAKPLYESFEISHIDFCQLWTNSQVFPHQNLVFRSEGHGKRRTAILRAISGWWPATSTTSRAWAELGSVNNSCIIFSAHQCLM